LASNLQAFRAEDSLQVFLVAGLRYLAEFTMGPHLKLMSSSFFQQAFDSSKVPKVS